MANIFECVACETAVTAAIAATLGETVLMAKAIIAALSALGLLGGASLEQVEKILEATTDPHTICKELGACS